MGETSTRSNSASRAICKACLMGTTPMLPPSGPISRTSVTRMPSFTLNSVALISFSYFKTVDQHSAGFWRTNNTTRGGESSIKQTVNDQNSSVAHGLDTFYNSGALFAIRSFARTRKSLSKILFCWLPSRTRTETCSADSSLSPMTSM